MLDKITLRNINLPLFLLSLLYLKSNFGAEFIGCGTNLFRIRKNVNVKQM